jgi:hypothetical protein
MVVSKFFNQNYAERLLSSNSGQNYLILMIYLHSSNSNFAVNFLAKILNKKYFLRSTLV